MPGPEQTGGARWETDCERYLNQHGFPGCQRERIRHPDRGDLGGLAGWTIECKGIAVGSQGGAFRIAPAIDQALKARAARGTPWAVVLRKRKYRPPEEGFAIMPLGQWCELAALLDGPGSAERSA